MLCSGGVLWDPLEVVVKGMMPLAALELLFMQEQSRYPGITLKSSMK